MIEALSLEQFHQLVGAYGADPDRWPAERRGGAVTCLVESKAARAAWRDAAALDVGLDRGASVKPSSELIAQVLAIGGASADRNTDWPAISLRHLVPYAAAAAIALIVGLAVPSPFRDGADTVQQSQIAAAAPLATEETSDELTSLALVDRETFVDEVSVSNGDSLLSALPLL